MNLLHYFLSTTFISSSSTTFNYSKFSFPHLSFLISSWKILEIYQIFVWLKKELNFILFYYVALVNYQHAAFKFLFLIAHSTYFHLFLFLRDLNDICVFCILHCHPTLPFLMLFLCLSHLSSLFFSTKAFFRLFFNFKPSLSSVYLYLHIFFLIFSKEY